jgi:hypothetical protein|uniref:Uncharacterized protein n=1 Tax=Panagrolaimus sp. PS1159 TaxID=55785 RepID=A0AC35GSA0_9BILA
MEKKFVMCHQKTFDFDKNHKHFRCKNFINNKGLKGRLIQHNKTTSFHLQPFHHFYGTTETSSSTSDPNQPQQSSPGPIPMHIRPLLPPNGFTPHSTAMPIQQHPNAIRFIQPPHSLYGAPAGGDPPPMNGLQPI